MGRRILLTLCLIGSGFFAQGQKEDPQLFFRGNGEKILAPDSVFAALKHAYNIAVRQNDTQKTMDIQREMGLICLDLGHLAQAIDYFQNAKRTAYSINDLNREALLSNDLGNVYYRSRLRTAAKKEHDEALALFQQARNNSGLGQTHGYIGHYYEKSGSYDSALLFQSKALSLYENIGDTVGMATIYENLGSIYEDRMQYDRALQFFKRAVEAYTLSPGKYPGIPSINNIGDIYRKTGQYDSARYWSHIALAMSIQAGNVYEQASAYKDLGETFHLLNENDSAFTYMKMSRKMLLNIYTAQNSQQTNFLNILYENEKRDQALQMLEKSKKISRILYVAIGTGVVLLVVIFYLVYSRQKMKIHKVEEEAAQNEAQNKMQQLQIDQKTKELANHTIAVVQRNQFLDDLKDTLATMVKDDKRDQKRQMQSLIQKINQNSQYESQWQEFNRIFEEVHPSFFQKINRMFPDLSSNDIKLLALHKMKMESKEMSLILGISTESLRVSRYRLRKKMGLGDGVSLSNYLQET